MKILKLHLPDKMWRPELRTNMIQHQVCFGKVKIVSPIEEERWKKGKQWKSPDENKNENHSGALQKR